MEFSKKLQKLRKEKGMSQEDLAEMLTVSRQSVSRWESGGAYPEMDKLIAISNIFQTTLDWLVKENDDIPRQESISVGTEEPRWNAGRHFSYEYKSKKTLFGLPLVHVNVGRGFKKAEGIVAIGNAATGVVAIGLVSIGIISIGVASVGFIGLGVICAALLAIGTFALGGIAIGAIAVGVFAFGAIAAGMFSFGALAVASQVAIGHTATGQVAIGEVVNGIKAIEVEEINRVFVSLSREQVHSAITEQLPNLWKGVVNFICGMFKH